METSYNLYKYSLRVSGLGHVLVVLLSSKLWPSDGPFAEQNIFNFSISFIHWLICFTIQFFHTKLFLLFWTAFNCGWIKMFVNTKASTSIGREVRGGTTVSFCIESDIIKISNQEISTEKVKFGGNRANAYPNLISWKLPNCKMWTMIIHWRTPLGAYHHPHFHPSKAWSNFV